VSEIGWFEDDLRERVDNGQNSSFLNDPWLDDGLLRYKFNRLFDLHIHSDILAAKMRRLCWALMVWVEKKEETFCLEVGTCFRVFFFVR